MKDYTIILTKILGKDRYEQLVDYSFKKVQVKFGNIRTDRVTKIVKINHQALMIISILKARQCSDIEIMRILHWDKKKSYKYVVSNSFEEFKNIYEEYINLIIEFIQKT
jgi:hypothetical protein